MELEQQCSGDDSGDAEVENYGLTFISDQFSKPIKTWSVTRKAEYGQRSERSSVTHFFFGE